MPRTVGGLDRTFRFDESLHRAVTHFVLQEGACGKVPLWMRDGLARYASTQTCSEWTPVELPSLIAMLHSGRTFPLRNLENEFIGEFNPYCRVYSALLIQEWTEQVGFEKILAMFHRIRAGDDWIEVLESGFGKSLEALDTEVRARILKRYKHLAPANPRTISSSILFDGQIQTDSAKIERARLFLLQQRYGDASRALADLLLREAPPTRALLLAGEIAAEKGTADDVVKHIRLALELEKIREEKFATAGDYENLGEALRQLGESETAAQAFLKAIEINPRDPSDHGPFGKLVELLGKQDPKPDAYYKALELAIPARRTDAKLRLELGIWYEKKEMLEKAFNTYRSAVGIRPESMSIHRALAPLAQRLGKTREANASYRAIHLKRPREVAVLQELLQCAETLSEEENAAYYRQKIRELTGK